MKKFSRWAWGVSMLLLGWIYSYLPPSPDQFEFEYLAAQMWAGQHLYSDLVDMNWPLAVLIHLPTAWYVPVESWFPWRAFDFALALAGTYSLSRIVAPLADSAASWSLWLYPFAYVTLFGPWFAGQPDSIAAHLLLAALALLCRNTSYKNKASLSGSIRTRPAQGLRDVALAGMLVGCAISTKPTAGLVAPLVALSLLLNSSPLDLRLRRCAVLTVAAFFALGLTFVVVLVSGTPLAAVWQMAFEFNALSRPAADRSLPAVLLTIIGHWSVLSCFSLLGVAHLWRRRPLRRHPSTLFLGALALGGLASYFVQGQGFRYHTGIWAAAWIGLASCGAGVATRLARSGAPPLLVVGRLALLLFSIFFLVKLNSLFPPLSGALSSKWRAPYLSGYTAGSGLSMAEAEEVARLVRRTSTCPNDSLLLFGTNSAIHHMTGRPQPTGFYYAPVLVQAQGLKYRKHFNARFMAELNEKRPEFIVESPMQEQYAPEVPELSAYLNRLMSDEYEEIFSVGLAKLKRRKASACSPFF